MQKMKTKGKRKTPIRSIIQIFFFLLVAMIAINHTLAESGRSIPFLSNASLHAVCPFGGVVTIYQFVTTGTFVQKVHESSFILMIIAFFTAILFGPAFCGWICPLGSIQEWFGKFGRKIFKTRYNRFVPVALDRTLRYVRYAVLVWVLYMTAISGQLIFQEIDPYFALFNFWSSEVAIGGLIVLAATLLLSLFVERPWCKYACPYGAVLGITNLFRIFKIQRQPSTCINCGLCTKQCPMNIDVANKTLIKDHQCISCLECTSEAVCPVPETVTLKAGR
jgi:polyferredoxin